MQPLFIVLRCLLVAVAGRWYALKTRPPLRDPHGRLMTRIRRWLRFKRAQWQAAAIQREINRRYAFTLGSCADGSVAEPPVQVGYLENLSPEDRKAAEAHLAHVKAQVRREIETTTDPGTRPGFAGAGPADKGDKSAQLDFKRLGGYRPAKVNPVTGDIMEPKAGGFLPPIAALTADERTEMLKSAVEGGFNINLFPRGDIENFSVSRWAMASERAQHTLEGGTAFKKWAPWESQYYYACEQLALSNKAMGDMVSGQDGGFLAPEEWSSTFIDQLYPQLALSKLPITRMNMGTRIVHLPKLTAAVSIFYAAENASITASQAQLSQLSFTARKQTFLVQLSNELIRDSNPAAEGVLRNNATRYMAIDRDKQVLIGNGRAGAPVGILNATNVTVAGGSATAPYATNAAPVFTDFNTAIYNVENLNGSTNVPLAQAQCTGIVGPVALKQQVLNMVDTTNNRPIYDYGINYMRGSNRLDGSSMLDGLFGVDRWVLTNILAGTANTRNVFFGDWQHVIIMERQDIEIVSSNVAGTAFQNDQTWIRGISRYDVGVAHPEAFYVVNNA